MRRHSPTAPNLVRCYPLWSVFLGTRVATCEREMTRQSGNTADMIVKVRKCWYDAADSDCFTLPCSDCAAKINQSGINIAGADTREHRVSHFVASTTLRIARMQRQTFAYAKSRMSRSEQRLSTWHDAQRLRAIPARACSANQPAVHSRRFTTGPILTKYGQQLKPRLFQYESTRHDRPQQHRPAYRL